MDGFTGFSQNQVALIVLLGLLPFLMIAVTSFIKFAVVISLLRNALGIQQIPPNIVIYSIALVMSAYVMLPTGMQSGKVVQAALAQGKPVLQEMNAIAEPFVDFVQRYAARDEVAFFRDSAKRMWGEDIARDVLDTEANPLTRLVVLMPAFMVSELSRAFQIGFLLYLPFIVIDLIVANILLALGMSSLSPVTVSLPLKLLLFIALDGWKRLLEALVLSYGVV
jgi:type III secretion protein R